MACRGRRHALEAAITASSSAIDANVKTSKAQKVTRLLFGVESRVKADSILQNNLTEFEWVVRNKAYPNFWGRNIVGDNALTQEEILFIHKKGCRVTAIYSDSLEKKTEGAGNTAAAKAAIAALQLGIPVGSAIFLEIGENEDVSREYMKGYAMGIIDAGYLPAFKANTDAKFDFDRIFSRGMQTDRDIFEKCIIWSVSPSLPEYDSVTTTHLIHPDNWKPHAPSAIKRNDIAVWQYGKNCHPIDDDEGNETSFNICLVRNEDVIIDVMF